MVFDETILKLHRLRLSGFIEALELQTNDPDYENMGFEARLAVLVDHEYAKRQNKAYERRVRAAKFQDRQAAVADIQYLKDRKLDRALIQELATCNYIREHRNVVILGATGAGKSYLAQALGNMACIHKFDVRYTSLRDLLDELKIARSKDFQTLLAVKKQYIRCQLLLIDDFLLFPVDEEDVANLLQIIDNRYMTGSTIVVSQFSSVEWLEQMPIMPAAEAITDRLTAKATQIVIQGDKSMRLR